MTHLERLRAALANDGRFDALIITSEINQRYLTGFNYTDGLVLVTEKRACLLADFRYIEAAKAALMAAKNFLGIESPSKVFRDEVGAMMAEGMAVGFEDNVPVNEIESALQPMTSVVPDTFTGSQYSYGGFTINVYGAPGQDVNALADIISDRINAQIARGRAVFA